MLTNYIGKKVRVFGLNDFTSDDFGLTEEEFKKLLSYDNKIATITDISCLVDEEEFGSNYYIIIFDDKFETDISGLHLSII